jgi:uncharacterized coiled-coil protein SlyX
MEDLRCAWHPHNEALIAEIREAMKEQTSTVGELRIAVVKLTENMRAVEKLDARLDKMEMALSERDKRQDSDIEQLKQFMWKATGILAVISVALPILLPLFLP